MSDYIKREDAKKWLTNLREDCGRYQDLWPYAEALNQIIESLDADVAPVRHGRWVTETDTDWAGGGYWRCSNCGYCFSFGAFHEMDESNYCPHCGAIMDEEVEE